VTHGLTVTANGNDITRGDPRFFNQLQGGSRELQPYCPIQRSELMNIVGLARRQRRQLFAELAVEFEAVAALKSGFATTDFDQNRVNAVHAGAGH
jgi:hypothetical protein